MTLVSPAYRTAVLKQHFTDDATDDWDDVSPHVIMEMQGNGFFDSIGSALSKGVGAISKGVGGLPGALSIAGKVLKHHEEAKSARAEKEEEQREAERSRHRDELERRRRELDELKLENELKKARDISARLQSGGGFLDTVGSLLPLGLFLL